MILSIWRNPQELAGVNLEISKSSVMILSKSLHVGLRESLVVKDQSQTSYSSPLERVWNTRRLIIGKESHQRIQIRVLSRGVLMIILRFWPSLQIDLQNHILTRGLAEANINSKVNLANQLKEVPRELP